jgi:hypothetical protein
MQLHLKTSPAAPVSPAHLTAFVTADLRFDIPAIKADAKARYGAKLDFINRYTGTAKRYWQWRQARQAIRQAWREAKDQLHTIVMGRLAFRETAYTAVEREQVAMLLARMGRSPITASGNRDFKAASAEYAQINFTAQQRAYFAIIRQARGEA